MHNQAQSLLGVHAGCVFLGHSYGYLLVTYADGLPYRWLALCFWFVAPWMSLHNKHVATFAWWLSGSILFGSTAILHSTWVHALLLSTLFLLPQAYLPTRESKIIYGILIVCLLFGMHHAEKDVISLVTGYAMAIVWSLWVVYDTAYWYIDELLEDPYEIALQTARDLLLALFSVCLPQLEGAFVFKSDAPQGSLPDIAVSDD